MGNLQLVQLVETSFSGWDPWGNFRNTWDKAQSIFLAHCRLPKMVQIRSVQFSSVQSLRRVWLCNPMNRSTPGLPVHHKLPEFTQTRLGDAIQQIPGQAVSGGPQAPSALLPAPTQSHWPSCLQPPLFQHVVALQKLYFSEMSYKTLKFFKEIKLARLKTPTLLIYSHLKYQQAF